MWAVVCSIKTQICEHRDKFRLVHARVCLCKRGCAWGTQVWFSAPVCTQMRFLTLGEVHSDAHFYSGVVHPSKKVHPGSPECTRVRIFTWVRHSQVFRCDWVHLCITRVHLDARKVNIFSLLRNNIHLAGFPGSCSPRVYFLALSCNPWYIFSLLGSFFNGVEGSLHSGTISGITNLIAGTSFLLGMFKIQSWELR